MDNPRPTRPVALLAIGLALVFGIRSAIQHEWAFAGLYLVLLIVCAVPIIRERLDGRQR